MIETMARLPSNAKHARKRLGLLSLQNALWVVAIIAVWSSWYIKTENVKRLKARIAVIQPLSRELMINDPNQFAVVSTEDHFSAAFEWEVYVPTGFFELCIATREIMNESVPAVAGQSIPIISGRHKIEIRQTESSTGWRVIVLCDGKEVLGMDETKAWNPKGGAVGPRMLTLSEQRSTQAPLVLFHQRFLKPRPHNAIEPGQKLNEGVALWVRQTRQQIK